MRIPVAELEVTLAHYRGATSDNELASLWDAVAAAQPIGVDAETDGALPVLSDGLRLARALALIQPRSSPERIANVGTLLLDSLHNEHAAPVDVLLRRAANPNEALATWPLRTLFNDGEISLIERYLNASPTCSRAAPARASVAAGRDADYSGRVTVIAKVTRLCNLRCSYCNDWRAGPGNTMAFPVLCALMNATLRDPAHTIVDFVWHGGEPSLLGTRWFLRALALQRRFARAGQVIHNQVQTNATLLDQEWVTFLVRHRLGVSVSFDGRADVHDRQRPDVKGRPSAARVTEGLARLREAGVPLSVLVVVTPEVVALGADSLVASLRELGVGVVGLLPVRPGADGGLYLPIPDYVHFAIGVNEAVKRAGIPLRVRELDAMRNLLRGEPAGFCELQGNCHGAVFSIEPNGSIGHCDKFVGDATAALGSLCDDVEWPLSAARAHQRLRTLQDQQLVRLRRVTSCRWARLCRGWCPHEHHVAEQRGTPLAGCCGLAPLFEHLEPETQS